jgi:hypothetical protein
MRVVGYRTQDARRRNDERLTAGTQRTRRGTKFTKNDRIVFCCLCVLCVLCGEFVVSASCVLRPTSQIYYILTPHAYPLNQVFLPAGGGDGGGTVGDIELAIDGAEVGIHGMRANSQAGGDDFIAQPLCDEGKQFNLAGGE